MARRIEIELTSARADGTWTWRAAGALNPRGALDGSLLYSGAKAGDVVRAEAEFSIEGITVISVEPPRPPEGEDPNRIEVLSRAAPGGVTAQLVGQRGPSSFIDRGSGDRGDGERGNGAPARAGADGRARAGAARAGADSRGRAERSLRARPEGSRQERPESAQRARPERPHQERPESASRDRRERVLPRRPQRASGGLPELPSGRPPELAPGGRPDADLGGHVRHQRGPDERGRPGANRAGGGNHLNRPEGRAAIASPAVHRGAAATTPGPGGPRRRGFSFGNAHRNALLESLPPEHQPIAQQLMRGGIPAVRTALHFERERAREEGRPEPSTEGVLAIAESLASRVKAAEWHDRAEAAVKLGDDLPTRDLRLLVNASDQARDEGSRALAATLREMLERRIEAQRQAWEGEVAKHLDEGQVLKALRLSARPPDPGARFSALLATRLRDAASAALAPDVPAERWLALLQAAADSPVRRSVKPLGLPEQTPAEVLDAARQQCGRVPALAPLLGLPVPPPPGPARPLVKAGPRQPPAHFKGTKPSPSAAERSVGKNAGEPPRSAGQATGAAGAELAGAAGAEPAGAAGAEPAGAIEVGGTSQVAEP